MSSPGIIDTAKDPRDRHSSAAELAAELVPALVAYGGMASTLRASDADDPTM